MELLFFILGLGGLLIFIQWRSHLAQKSLEGKLLSDIFPPSQQHMGGVLYYFYHSKCGPCRKMLPVIDHLLQEFPDQVEKINLADNLELAIAVGVKATPTIIYAKNNKIIKAIIGYASEQNLKDLLLASKN